MSNRTKINSFFYFHFYIVLRDEILLNTQKKLQMEKKWKKISTEKYALILDNVSIGEMEISSKSTASKAICSIGEQKFTIQKTGFWKNDVEVLDNSGELIAKIYNEKWYVSSSILDYKNKKYKIKLRNNPLAELVLLDEKNELLAYGIKAEKEGIKVQISMQQKNTDVFFDFILWYLFMPIVIENTDDNYVFQMLLSV